MLQSSSVWAEWMLERVWGNFVMRVWSRLVAAVIPLSLGGCATLPEMQEDAVETAEVVRNIKCEFRDAVWQGKSPHDWLAGWNGAFVVTLAVNHKGTGTVDSNLVHPLNVGGNFSLPIVFTGYGEATRTEKITFKEKIADLKEVKSIKCPSDPGIDKRHALLGGEIGIADLLDRAREARKVAGIRPSNLDYTLNFRIVKTGNIGPRFSLVPVGVNTLTAGAKWEGNRERTHTLNVTLQPNPPECLFKDLEKRTGVCPDFVVSIPLDPPKTSTVLPPETGGPPGAQPRVPFETIVPRPTKPGVSRPAEDALDRALTRSILQDTLEEIRRRGISQP